MKSAWNGLWLGGVAGAVLCAGLGIRWSGELAVALSDPVTTTWLSALGGAVIGGLISYFIARQASQETLQRDEEVRTNTEHAGSLRAMVTAMQIANRTFTLNKELQAAVAASDGRPPWQSMLASAGSGSSAPTFEAGDFISFIKNNRSDVVHRAMLASERLAALESALDMYSSKRQAFQEFSQRYTRLNSTGVAEVVFVGDDVGIAKLKSYELGQLFDQMLALSNEYFTDAQNLCTDMNTSHQSYFGKKAAFKLDLVAN